NGGGLFNGSAYNCLIVSNSATGTGGGAFNTALVNCTVVGNKANIVGGLSSATANNCIVYYNSGSTSNYTATMNFCCTTPAPGTGTGITNEPVFADLSAGDFHL